MHHSKVALVVVMMFAVGHVVSFQLRPTYQRTTVPPPTKRIYIMSITIIRSLRSIWLILFYFSLVSCNGVRNYELSIATNDQERLEINELIYQIQFESILSMFFDAIHSAVSNGLEVAGSFVGGLAGRFGAGTKVESKTFYTHKSYRLNGRLRGDEADFRIQSSSGTYSHVVIKIGIVFGVREIRNAFMRSCDCGETVYLL